MITNLNIVQYVCIQILYGILSFWLFEHTQDLGMIEMFNALDKLLRIAILLFFLKRLKANSLEVLFSLIVIILFYVMYPIPFLLLSTGLLLFLKKVKTIV
jgi:hypothetical protein